MKTTYDILAISPTQWVLVDKTRIPRVGEANCFVVKHGEYEIQHRAIAAYPKIEGVLLLPSLLWEKKNAHELAKLAYPLGESKPYLEQMASMRVGFVEGYEAAGGYTKEQMEKCWEAAEKAILGSAFVNHEGLILYSGAEVDRDKSEFFKAQNNPSPRALEIDVNEDGSIPSDNGTIIYTKPIY